MGPLKDSGFARSSHLLSVTFETVPAVICSGRYWKKLEMVKPNPIIESAVRDPRHQRSFRCDDRALEGKVGSFFGENCSPQNAADYSHHTLAAMRACSEFEGP
jgi:hypothetical protein